MTPARPSVVDVVDRDDHVPRLDPGVGRRRVVRTSVTSAPWPPSERSSSLIPRKPSARASPPSALRSASSTDSTSSAEMANPTFVAAVATSLRATAVLMPTMRPRASTSGPPELPEEIAASVWIRPSRAPPSSVMSVRSSADTIPSVTLGSPSRSRAKPMATTSSPSPTSAVGANATGRGRRRRCDSRARSLPASEATSSASIGSVSPASRTRIVGGPGDDVGVGQDLAVRGHDTPVPTARPPATSALIVTTDGPTASATARTGSRALERARRQRDRHDRRVRSCRRRRRRRRPPDEHADEPGHERRRRRRRRRPASPPARRTAPGGLGGRARTPGAGGGSTGIGTVHLLGGASPRRGSPAPFSRRRSGAVAAVDQREDAVDDLAVAVPVSTASTAVSTAADSPRTPSSSSPAART